MLGFYSGVSRGLKCFLYSKFYFFFFEILYTSGVFVFFFQLLLPVSLKVTAAPGGSSVETKRYRLLPTEARAVKQRRIADGGHREETGVLVRPTLQTGWTGYSRRADLCLYHKSHFRRFSLKVSASGDPSRTPV